MGIPLSTAGSMLAYGFETTKNTRPVISDATFTKLADVIETPDFNPAPNDIQTTPLSATEYHTSISGLKSLGIMSINCNTTSDLIDAWQVGSNSVCSKAKAAEADGKRMWIFVYLKNLGKVYAHPVSPIKFNLGALTVDTVAQSPLYVSSMGDGEFVSVSEDTNGFPTEASAG